MLAAGVAYNSGEVGLVFDNIIANQNKAAASAVFTFIGKTYFTISNSTLSNNTSTTQTGLMLVLPY